jgi:hypothetical protein
LDDHVGQVREFVAIERVAQNDADAGGHPTSDRYYRQQSSCPPLPESATHLAY